jgi:hypothetical protein
MSVLPQNKFFLWVDWYSLAPTYIRTQPPHPALGHPLHVPWQRYSNNFLLADDQSVNPILSHMSEFPSCATILMQNPSSLSVSLLTPAAFLVVKIAPDAPLLLHSQDGSVAYSSDYTTAFFLSTWLPPPSSPTVISIDVHPDWNTNVPVRNQPLIVSAWIKNLSRHPNDDLVLSTLDNATFGASYDYTGNRVHPLISPTPSSFFDHDLQPAISADEIKGFRTKPFPYDGTPPLFNCHRSPIKGVTKTFDMKVRLVNDHGAPYDGTDVNSNIDIITATLFTFQVAMALLLLAGKGALMFKYDVTAAYKVLNLHPQDWHLNGESLPGAWSFSVKPNFGARSAGKLWDALGGLAEFIFRHVATLIIAFHFLVRYSDDYMEIIPPCTNHMFTALTVFAAVSAKSHELGLSIGKFTFPSTKIVWLGLVLDSMTMTAELTNERRLYLLHHIQLWMKRSYASPKEIESFHGHLQFAASIIRHGRFFLGGITALIYASPGARTITIGKAAKADLSWWYRLLVSYKWSGIHHLVRNRTPANWIFEITTDACKKARGGYFNGRWFSLAWTSSQLEAAMRTKDLSMVYLELHAIVDSCATFGHLWSGLSITIQTDSMSVVEAWNSQKSKNTELRSLFCEICLFMSLFDFDLNIIHLPGKENIKADLLSRLQVAKFLRLFPAAESSETTVSEWWLRN